jgi:hypothetical protein
MSTTPFATGVPAAVPAGQVGAAVPGSGTEAEMAVSENTVKEAERAPIRTLVTRVKFAPVIVIVVPAGPEEGLMLPMIGVVCRTR